MPCPQWGRKTNRCTPPRRPLRPRFRGGFQLVEDDGLRIAGQSRRKRCPHLFAHELPVFVCAVDGVEKEKFYDALRVALGLEDLYRGNPSLLARGRAAGELPQSRVEVGNPVLDLQDGHGPVSHVVARYLDLLIFLTR